MIKEQTNIFGNYSREKILKNQMFIYHNYSCKTMWPGIAKEKVA